MGQVYGAVLGFMLLLALEGVALGEPDRAYYTDRGQFNYASFLLKEGEYQKASREFSRFIESFPASPFIEEAQLRLAEAYLKAGFYKKAKEELELYLTNFPSGGFNKDALGMAAQAQSGLLNALPKVELKPEAPTVLKVDLRLRAVQVMLFEGKDISEVSAELERLKASGIDTVILRVFHNDGDRFYPFVTPGDKRGVYFKTKHAPVVDDMLGKVIDAAHGLGLRVFAWMTTRYADYGVEDDMDLACRGYDISTGAIVRCKGMDLFNERAAKRLEAIYSDLAEYGIDGVLFQDDLVLRHTEGFGPYMAGLFKKETGRALSPEALYIKAEGGKVYYTELFWQWASWKNRRLLSLAERLRQTVKKKRPGALFAINLMYETVTNPPYALAWLSQDLGEARKAGFDYYSIMAYHRQMEDELNKGPGEIREMIGRMVEEASTKIGEPERVLIKLQTVDWKTGAPLSYPDIVDIIRAVRSKKGVSIAVVPYRGDFPFSELGEGKDYVYLN